MKAYFLIPSHQKFSSYQDQQSPSLVKFDVLYIVEQKYFVICMCYICFGKKLAGCSDKPIMTIPSATLLKLEIVGPSMLLVLVVHRFIFVSVWFMSQFCWSKYNQTYDKDYERILMKFSR